MWCVIEKQQFHLLTLTQSNLNLKSKCEAKFETPHSVQSKAFSHSGCSHQSSLNTPLQKQMFLQVYHLAADK